MRVYLTGFMGAGKTTIGGLLSAELGWPMVDLDREIEREAGMKVDEIFRHWGEEKFRSLEQVILRSSAARQDVVVATGGGTVLTAENREFMASHGLVVWLNPTFERLLRRLRELGSQGRPLFRPGEEARELFLERLPVYRLAEAQLDVEDEEDAGEVARRLLRLLRERECAI